MRFRVVLSLTLTTFLTVSAHASPDLKDRVSLSISKLVSGWNTLTNSNQPTDPQIAACADYQPGETRNLSTKLDSYLVTRMKQQNWAVRLNFNYVSGGDVTPAQLQSFRKKVKSCYEDAGYIRDPDGQGLRLMLTEPGQRSHEALRPITITLHNDLSHANSRNYYRQASCRTIIHESLHMLGLWDEYAEGRKNLACRSVNNSIMADQNVVFIDTLERIRLLGVKGNQSFRPDRKNYFKINAAARFVAAQTVTCTENGKPLKKSTHFTLNFDRRNQMYWLFRPQVSPVRVYESMDRLYVPEAAVRPEVSTPEISALYLGGWVGGYMKLDPRKWSCRVTPPPSNALVRTGQELLAQESLRQDLIPLRPAHFRKILYPDCVTKNRVYDICTAEAYLTPPPGHQCLRDTYTICNTPHWLD